MSDPSIPSADAPVAPPAKPAALWEDFIDIFYAPAEVFARRAKSGWGLPMLICTVLIGVISYANAGAMQPIMDAEFTRNTAAAMKANPQVTAEQMASVRSMGEKFAVIGGFFVGPFGIFFTGLFLWVVGKFVDAKQTLGAALMVAAYSYTIKIVETAVGGLQALLLDPASMTGRLKVSLGVGRFLDPDTTQPMLLALLARVDVFTIWLSVLLAIGLSVTGGISRQKAAIAAVILWILGAIPMVLQAARM